MKCKVFGDGTSHILNINGIDFDEFRNTIKALIEINQKYDNKQKDFTATYYTGADYVDGKQTAMIITLYADGTIYFLTDEGYEQWIKIHHLELSQRAYDNEASR